jgi:hypothetical protein
MVNLSNEINVDARGVSTHPQLDLVTADEVATHFLDVPNSPRDPKVFAAYAELEAQSDSLFAAITRPGGIRIVFTRCSTPYSSDTELIQAVRSEGQLEVTASCVDNERCHPVLGNGFAGPYDRFRAVHDVAGHVRLGTGFDRQGEYTTWLAQDRQYQGLARWALATELHAENSVLWFTGEPAEHKAILLDPGLLSRARCGR